MQVTHVINALGYKVKIDSRIVDNNALMGIMIMMPKVVGKFLSFYQNNKFEPLYSSNLLFWFSLCYTNLMLHNS